MNMPKPVTAASTKAAQVQGNSLRVTWLTGYRRAARPSSRRSTIRIDPTTRPIAITWIDSSSGNHQVKPMCCESGWSCSHCQNDGYACRASQLNGTGKGSVMYSEYAIHRPASMTPIQRASDTAAMIRAASSLPGDCSQ